MPDAEVFSALGVRYSFTKDGTGTRLLIGHDGSSYADAALEDLKYAGLPVASPEIIEPAFAGEKVRSIVDHANGKRPRHW